MSRARGWGMWGWGQRLGAEGQVARGAGTLVSRSKGWEGGDRGGRFLCIRTLLGPLRSSCHTDPHTCQAFTLAPCAFPALACAVHCRQAAPAAPSFHIWKGFTCPLHLVCCPCFPQDARAVRRRQEALSLHRVH